MKTIEGKQYGTAEEIFDIFVEQESKKDNPKVKKFTIPNRIADRMNELEGLEGAFLIELPYHTQEMYNAVTGFLDEITGLADELNGKNFEYVDMFRESDEDDDEPPIVVFYPKFFSECPELQHAIDKFTEAKKHIDDTPKNVS